MTQPITFVVSGVPRGADTRGSAAPPIPAGARVKNSVVVSAQRAARGGDVRLATTPGEDVVVVHIAGGPSLWLHPEHARDLLLAQHDRARKRGADEAEPPPGEVRVPTRLQWRLEDAVPGRGMPRGFLGDVLIRAIDVITGLLEDKAADFVASKVVEKFDSRVDDGVYQLATGRLEPLRGKARTTIPDAGNPSLVLAHGTFSETSGTFGKLWLEHPHLVRSLFEKYEGRVYALDHPTLGASPIANAITLANSVSKNARLHLLTHSRGGLVAEVFARVAAAPSDAFEPFKGKAYTEQRKELQRLANLVREKNIRVDRVVRVACPARGTLLASKRLDAYVSVVKWSLDLAGVPVVPELLGFLGEVARRRADPETLPGLAAQIPGSPLVEWLNGIDHRIVGDLRVVAGDLEGDSVVSWVKTLLSDAFYWADNDLVVQTRSMYGGMPRGKSTFVLEQGGKTSHFNYFSNAESAKSIVAALVAEEPASFRTIGPLSWAGESSTGVRASLPQRRNPDAARLPALFLLPDAFGSHLRAGKERVWLSWRMVNGFDRLAYADGDHDVEPDGVLDSFYGDVSAFLSADHDVIPFAFDWRRPIEEEARRLAKAVDAALKAREKSGMPVRMLAHSMGGIVARTMQLESPATWTRMMKVDGARLLMLGTPNGGSWAPMQILSGDDTLGNVVAWVGAPFSGNAARQQIAEFPGLLQLQADLLGDLGKEERWKILADADLAAIQERNIWHRLPLQLEQFRWGIPPQRVLTAAAKLRRRLDQQREKGFGTLEGKLSLVVGSSVFTAAGIGPRNKGDEPFVYVGGPFLGDGTVTHESALLPGVETWTVDSEHGELPRRREAFEAYRDLLKTGKTDRLLPFSTSQAPRRDSSAAQALVRSRPSRAIFGGAPPQRETELLAPSGLSTPAASQRSAGSALRVSIVHGDLTYIAEPLLIGHYKSSRLTGAEAVIDRAIGGTMSASLERGLYPVEPGTQQVFRNSQQAPDNPWQPPRPEAVIVAGLGPEGELRGAQLVQTVRQAILAWGQRLVERAGAPATFTLATTLLGSGGSGVSAGQAAQLIAQGVREANDLLAGEAERREWPRVERLRIIELYLDRATDAWRSLQSLSASSPALFTVDPVIEAGTGGLRRTFDSGYRGADYDFISAVTQRAKDEGERIVYTVDTRRARSEVRAHTTQIPLIRNLVCSASCDTNADPLIGGTLFRLLVPVDLEPFMCSSIATVIEVDSGTAGIPWEILDSSPPGSSDERPWAIRTKLLRKLRMGAGSARVADATADDSVLVIGDPSCDRDKYPKLYGAREEAAAVARLLGADSRGQPHLMDLVSAPDPSSSEADATAVVNAVGQRGWRIIHIAGHGEPPLTTGDRTVARGVVLSNDTFLGPDEIGALRIIPELVFVNCCHLAQRDPKQLLHASDPQADRFDLSQFAASVAEALIQSGVRCVIAAGWAVNDQAALEFAERFYKHLLEGHSFIDAVSAAREAARVCGGNTWAAYQCYGDPDWRYRRGTGDGQRPPEPPPSQEFAGIASSSALVLALETLAVKSEFQGAKQGPQAERLRYLEDAFEPLWQGNGQAIEAFGTAWAKARDFDEAIKWYKRARTAPDGSSSLVAIEQLASLKARAAWNLASKAGATADDRGRARSEIGEAIDLLETLVAVGPTLEREAIYGATFKRLALIEAADGHFEDERKAIEQMKAHYAKAEEIGNRSLQTVGTTNAFYPAMNRIAAQLALGDDASQQSGLSAETIEKVRRAMLSAPQNFWSVVGQTELDMYASIHDRSLESKLDDLEIKFRKQHERVNAPQMWASVLDNAVFVLSKYVSRATATEATAAQRLLRTLAELADLVPPAPGPKPAKRGVRKSGRSTRRASTSKRRRR